MPVRALEKSWVIEAGEGAYAIAVAADGEVLQTYWGARLPDLADYPAPTLPRQSSFEHPLQLARNEIATGEGGASYERTLDVVTAAGLRGLVLRFRSADVTDRTLVLTLEDKVAGLDVVLSYETFDAHGLMSRRVTIRNAGAGSAHVERAFSGIFNLPGRDGYALTHLEGRWGDELRIRRENFVAGTLTRESRRMTTSHGGVPFFAIDRSEAGLSAGEEQGAVWFGTLAWSGNWKLIAEQTRDFRSIIHLGLNDHDFGYDLPAGESFETPAVYFGYTEHGYGAMSRAFHDFIRDDYGPRPGYSPPVVYNSWYATTFDVTEAGQIALAEKAAAIGVELFVVDDGWFHKRDNDRAGLGDWWPDETKFPNKLGPLADAVHRLGMTFGLWIEPEMVNPDSDLYRAHPDWIIYMPGRERTVARNQSMLNVGRPDVQDYLIDIFDRLLRENPIDFIKWDMNRNVSEPGWPGHDRDEREIWVRYVDGLYRIWSELRRRHPAVIWENCSGGGGRIDLAMMGLTEQTWVSDNTRPPARLEIQEGFTLLFPASAMAAWVTDEDKDDYTLDLRFQVSMTGALGVGGNLTSWSSEELETGKRWVARYKQLRELVAGGDLYRLRSPHQTPHSAVAYVAKDKSEAVLFAYRTHEGRIVSNPTIYIAGLAPDAHYEIEGSDIVRSGLGWLKIGLEVPLKDFSAVNLKLRRVRG
jgi:alpha-galactosidase